MDSARLLRVSMCGVEVPGLKAGQMGPVEDRLGADPWGLKNTWSGLKAPESKS